MVNNKLRHGNCTSSEIVALTKMGSREMTPEEMEQYKNDNPKGRKKTIESWPGEAAYTYIEETNMERTGERCLTTEVDARPLKWGKLLESLLFTLLGIEYILTSTDTVLHKVIRWWAGSPDGYKTDTVMDIKCPFTFKSFCQLVDPLYSGLTGWDAMNAIRDGWVDKLGVRRKAHKDGEKFYWQLVSNAILTGKKYAELIVYMPYQSELEAIKAEACKPENVAKNFWLTMSNDDELPYLVEGGYYNNINIIRFEVPEADKLLLTKRVLQAGAMLYKNTDLSTLRSHWALCTGSVNCNNLVTDEFVHSVYMNDLKYEQVYEQEAA
jgi:hypothetical protein